MKRTVALTALLALVLGLFACAAPETPELSSGTARQQVQTDAPTQTPTIQSPEQLTPTETWEPIVLESPIQTSPPAQPENTSSFTGTSESCRAYAAFSARLLRDTLSEGNTLLSPLSVLSALAMVGEGADGETHNQMEQALGLSMEEIRELLGGFSTPEEENILLSNALWINDALPLTVRQEYTAQLEGLYGAELFRAPFSPGTVEQVNDWVKAHTKERIDRILDQLDPNTKLLLINALTFDGTWEKPYRDDQLQQRDFTPEGGDPHPVQMLTGGKEHVYLESDYATGFLKPYQNSPYAFGALLPAEGVSLEELVEQLSRDDGLWWVLSNQTRATVQTVMPKLDEEYSTELAPVLSAMGMEDLFLREKADLTGIGGQAGDLFVNFVKHKTCLRLDENGTEAAAVTAIGVKFGAVPNTQQDVKQVILDRPFVYMIVDTEQNLPIFLGTIRDVQP